MFCKLSLLIFVAPIVSALTLQVPENPTTGGTVTIKWSSAPTDPDTFTLELTNPAFNQAIAIANNVNPTAGQVTFTLPAVPPGANYGLQAVNIGNITDVFSTTPTFSIGASTATGSSASSTSGTASSASSSSTGSSSSSATTPATSATSAFSSIIVSNTAPSASTPSNTTAPAGTTPFSGALSSRLGTSPAGGIAAAVLLSAVAGAALITL